MKRWWKVALLSLLLCIVIPSVSFTGLLFSLDVYTWYAKNDTLLQDMEYDDIDSLHKAYSKAKLDASNEVKIKDEISFYVKIEDRYFVFCESYAVYSDGTVSDRENCLFVYTVKSVDDKYVLESQETTRGYNPSINDFYLSSHYISVQQADKLCFIEPEHKGDFKTVGFVYKDIADTRELYFNNVKMEEIEMVNPLTSEPFILCYAQSEKTVYHTFLWGIFLPQSDRHTIAAKAR